MKLGSVHLTDDGTATGSAWIPENWTPPIAEKKQSFVKTMTSVAYFSWGASIVGKEIDLEWKFMPLALFDALHDLFIAGASVLWDLDVAGMSNYYVEITEVEGELPEVVAYDQGYMHNVRVGLLILSETGAGTS